MARLPGMLRFARMAGSSVAAPGAAGWVTDFLNAAYPLRAAEGRTVRDLRLAHGIITTLWVDRGGRLGARDVFALNRAYGLMRLRRGGRLDHDALLRGACTLIGDWFPEAWWDHDARAGRAARSRPLARHIGAAAGRFTALRSSGLAGQSFEIEVVAEPAPRSPVFTRGYVTCTELCLVPPPRASRPSSTMPSPT